MGQLCFIKLDFSISAYSSCRVWIFSVLSKGLTTITFGFQFRAGGKRQGKVYKFILKILCRSCISFLFRFYLTEVTYMVTLGFKVFWFSGAAKT